MTVCNMSIEAGARAGMIAPDDTTFAFLEGRQHSPKGADWERALDDWRSLVTDESAAFDREVRIDAAALRPVVTWGTNPAQSVSIDGVVPDPASFGTPARAAGRRSARSTTWGWPPGTAMRDIGVDTVFIGSCTNGRLADLRAAAGVLRGRKVSHGVRAIVVPGSARVKAEAEAEGLDEVFTRGGLRVALGRLLDVPGHERRHPRAAASGARRRATGTSKAARVLAGAPTWSRPRWPPRPRSPGRFAVPGDLEGAR